MTTVLETIPEHLQHDVDLALAWFNGREGAAFEVTGIVNPPTTAGVGHDLQLILCGAGTCRQETFQVGSAASSNSEVKWLGEEPTVLDGVAELDPPPGALRRWIDEACGRHAFVVLLFYRGFW